MIFIFTLIICIHKSIFTILHVHCTLLIKGQHEKKNINRYIKAVSDTKYSEGDNNSGRGLSAREEGLTTSVGDLGSADPGSGSAYFYRDPRIFIGIQIRDPRVKQCGSPTSLKYITFLNKTFFFQAAISR